MYGAHRPICPSSKGSNKSPVDFDDIKYVYLPDARVITHRCRGRLIYRNVRPTSSPRTRRRIGVKWRAEYKGVARGEA